MNLLLDSHSFLWFVWDDPQLSPTAKALIEDPANRCLVSVASCWEISIKVGLKKLELGEPATTFVSRELTTNRFDLLGIELIHATSVEALPPHHKDPFDRLLVVQSMIENLPVVSADTQLDAYGITRLW
ncbi:type II toxin-antitoxin system VapC family toxin [Aquisphaera insulae]|uniref:type II toxin-antitoxin system VapC family toxin n=1 Tax=Aquisphaera insulae TaxID=2712864 RepID=UPI0013EC6C97|nr:type II toxin-antitoxin system VapC family toxin [Aquisphaera insulae]